VDLGGGRASAELGKSGGDGESAKCRESKGGGAD
jgi:hypothetical protein